MNIKSLLPLPDIEACQSILCIQPHPDDNEVGAGATLAMLAKKGCKITFLTVTDGSMGTNDPSLSPETLIKIRSKEILLAGEILGISKFLSLDYPDGGPYNDRELCQKIVSVIRSVQPEFVMTVDPFLPYEAHPDHRRVGMAVAEACLFSQFPQFKSYGDNRPCPGTWQVKGIAFYNTSCPNTFVSADKTWDLKLKAISAHQSQFSGDYLELMKQYFTYKAGQYGLKVNCRLAEAFKILTPALIHANVDAAEW